jgi:hypothetical protein
MYKQEDVKKKEIPKGKSPWMNFTSDKYPAPRAIEIMKILGALLELPAKQHCQSSPFTSKLGQTGQMAVLFSS